MNDKSNLIVPFDGFGDFKLYQSVDNTMSIIEKNHLEFNTEIWENKECYNPIPWTIIRVENKIHLFFANDKLFKIYVNNCVCKLPNGIYIGTPTEEALVKDKNLIYDEWEEDYQSSQGYWLEDELENKTVTSISVFIREAIDDDLFFKYEW